MARGITGCDVVHLFPRRKHSEHALTQKDRAPVLVQRDTISALFGRPQVEAAQELGVSVTTLKQVCRKLGVMRWPYSRSSKKHRTPAKIDVQCIPQGIIIESDYSYESSADSFSRVASSAATVVEKNVCSLSVPTEDISPQHMVTYTVQDSKLLSRPSIGGSSSFASSAASSFASSASLCCSVSASASFTVADFKLLGEDADEESCDLGWLVSPHLIIRQSDYSYESSADSSSRVASSAATVFTKNVCSLNVPTEDSSPQHMVTYTEATDKESCDLGWLVSCTSDPFFEDVMWARAHHEYARFCRFMTNV